MSRALREDEVIKFESKKPFELLPEGDYRFTIIEHKFELFDGNIDNGGKIPKCPKYNFTFRIENKTETVDMFWSYFHTDTHAWKIAQLCLALGLVKEGETRSVPWKELDGKRGICHIKQRKYRNSNGEEKQVNDIVGFIIPAQPEPLTPVVDDTELPF